MQTAPIPANEPERLAALHRYNLDGMAGDPCLSDLTNLIAHVCQTPIALVSLVDEHEVRCPARVGIELDSVPRPLGLCAHAIAQRESLVVPDTLLDARFHDHPYVVGAPHARFYAGVPLMTKDGFAIGTLCVIDRVPRQLTAGQLAALGSLARLVVSRIELHQALHEKQQTAAALRRAAAFQGAILAGADYAIIATDTAGRINTFNAAAERMLGYGAAEVIGQMTPERIHDRQEVEHRAAELSAELGRAIAPGMDVFLAKAHDGGSEEREWTYIRKDDSRFPVLLSVTALRDDDREFIGYLGIARDITERKRMTDSLRESEARKSAILDVSLDCIITMDERGRIMEFNPAAERTFGYRQAEVVGVELAEKIIPPRLREAHRQGMARFLAGGEARVLGRRIEVPALRADGSEFPAELAISVIRLGGHPLFTAHLRDITEQRAAEAARLRKTAAIEAADEGIAILNERGEYTYLNAAHVKMFGYGCADELLGHKWQQLYGPEEIARFEENVFPVLQSAGSWRGEATARRCDGSEFAEEVSLTKLPGGGLICVSRDVTERKQQDELLRRAKEATDAANAGLARAARLKDEFLANMSHELRTPLNAVLGLSEALLEQVSGPLNERQAKSLRVIHESGAHLLELINDILDLSKIEAGRVDLQLAAVPVEPLCRASLRLVKEAAYRKNLDVKLAVASGVSAVRADERRLKQVLVNLLSNAVKFTREGGALGLDVALNAERGAVEFTVWDTGIGMAEEDLGKLFQPFVQLDSGLARHHQGTGLGLALVRRLAELHGGSVGVTSELGRGTRFTVAIPAGKEAPEPVSEKSRPGIPCAPATDATASSSTGPLVLLAEDNEANVLTLRDYLEARGYRLLVASDGAEAVALAQTHAPQLILMDVQMPDVDGLEATRRIRALPALRTTPIIALTALAMPGDRERCLAAGTDDYLSKPVELRTLAARIAELLKR